MYILNVSLCRCKYYLNINSLWYDIHDIFPFIQAYLSYFAKSLAYEYKDKGITVQCLTPFYVATRMTRYSQTLSNPSMWIPSAAVYARQALLTLGLTERTAGYWPHAIQVCMRTIKYTPDKPHSHLVWRNAPQGTGRTLYRSVWEPSNIHQTSPTHTWSDGTHRRVLATRYTGLYQKHQIYTRQAPLTLGLTERTAGYWPHAIQVCMRNIKYTPDKPHSHWVWRNIPLGTGRTLYRSVWETSNIHQTSPTHTGSDGTHRGVLAARYTGLYENHQIQIYTRQAPLTLGLTERTAGYWPHAIQVCMRTIKYKPDKPHSHLVWRNAPQGTGRTLYRSVWEPSNIHQTSPTHTWSDGTHRRVLAARYTGLYEKHQIYTRQASLTLGLTERTAGYWPHAIQVCMRNIKYTPDKPH